MTVEELMRELEDIPGDAEVLVWDGYNAGSMTPLSDVSYDWAAKLVRLE
jgi:hypothetical protein